jgi:carbon storage regulator
MLVLSRKSGESIQIGPDVFVKVVQVRGGSVRLAFDAPPEVYIRRSELEARSGGEPASRDLLTRKPARSLVA